MHRSNVFFFIRNYHVNLTSERLSLGYSWKCGQRQVDRSQILTVESIAHINGLCEWGGKLHEDYSSGNCDTWEKAVILLSEIIATMGPHLASSGGVVHGPRPFRLEKSHSPPFISDRIWYSKTVAKLGDGLHC